MKQGTTFILPVTFEYDLSLVESVQFICKQDGQRVEFVYPSQNAELSQTAENVINLLWTKNQTYKFTPGKTIRMDTRIHLIGSDTNPQTSIVEFTFNPTLFDS